VCVFKSQYNVWRLCFGDAPKSVSWGEAFCIFTGVTGTDRSEFPSYFEHTYDARWSRLALGLLKSRDEPTLKNSKKATAALTAFQSEWRAADLYGEIAEASV
jgi:hypothetical protein